MGFRVLHRVSSPPSRVQGPIECAVPRTGSAQRLHVRSVRPCTLLQEGDWALYKTYTPYPGSCGGLFCHRKHSFMHMYLYYVLGMDTYVAQYIGRKLVFGSSLKTRRSPGIVNETSLNPGFSPYRGNLIDETYCTILKMK